MLRFGTSGIPLSTTRPGTEAGIRRIRELGLDHLEMGWVNGIKMSDETADRIARTARECDVSLTAHGPYYINLCGAPETVEASLGRLEHTARLGARCGAQSFCFHAGFYGAQAAFVARRRIGAALRRLRAVMKRERWRLDARPELTGKPSQVGSLEEIVGWSRSIPGIRPCVDFSHQYARSGGVENGYERFVAILEFLRDRLGTGALERLHVHISGIEFGPRGERRHLPLRRSRFRYRELLRALKDMNVGGWVVAESPAMEDDALLLQRAYRRLR
jgi:deoxyribonuclease-4